MAGSNIGLECRVLVCMDSNVDIKTVSKKNCLVDYTRNHAHLSPVGYLDIRE